MNDDGFIISISTSFVYKDGPEIFGNGLSHVGINNITCFNLKDIQSRNCDCNTDSLTWDYARVDLALGRFGHMPTSYKYCLASEFFHLHVNFHVKNNMHVTIQDTIYIRNDIKINLQILNLPRNFIG